MSNWLITADIHIDDYPSFNYENRSRLKQFDKLADRYLEIAKQYDCDTIVMAGDIINRPTNRPYVVIAIHQFLEKISKSFNKVYFILGQHDVDTKSEIIQMDDTIMTALAFPNFEYMDHRVLTLPNGKTIAFKDWTPKQDLSWIETPVDVLIAHYTKSGMFGQEIDESKFKVMLHGDIHNSQEIGKFISIGNPIQHNMSSQARGTALILNTDDCSWKRIPIDAEHTRFLRIDYTNKSEEEGFEGPLTYHIYKPVIQKDETKGFSQSIKWDEIEELISNMATERALGSIHAEVLGKHPEFSEIDFDFNLKRLYIHGYRSIVDFELNFTGNDRIILVGSNGSGKSSIIRALRALFDKSRYMPYEQSDFTNDMKVELEFVYQNKLYKLWKGSTWGLEVDGNLIGYNNKTEFEADILVQLPFLQYIDLFFITSNISNLSNVFTAERRIDLLSKFYRLDRIDAYNMTAIGLRDIKIASLTSSKEEINKLSGKVDAFNQRLSELNDYEGKDRLEYSSEVERLNSMKNKYEIHKDWKSQLSTIEAQLAIRKDQLIEYEKRLKININEYQSNLESVTEDRRKTQLAIDDLDSKRIRFGELSKELNDILQKGKSYKEQLDKLDSGVCPICGTKITNENTKRHKLELEQKREEALKRYYEITSELEKLPENQRNNDYFIIEKKRLKSLYDEYNDTVIMYTNRINQYNIAKSDYNKEQSAYDEVYRKMTSHKLNEPEDVVLPADFSTKLFNATSELTKFDEFVRTKELKEETLLEIQLLKDRNESTQREINSYNGYIELTNHAGDVMKAILDQMATNFSDSSIKYEVEQGVYRGKSFIKFDAYYKVKNKWRLYDSLSDGQKCISDLDFLNKLFSLKVGLLVMDESLKHLDFNMAPTAWEIISKMNVNSILIATHDANCATFTKKLMLELDSEGKTVVNAI